MPHFHFCTSGSRRTFPLLGLYDSYLDKRSTFVDRVPITIWYGPYLWIHDSSLYRFSWWTPRADSLSWEQPNFLWRLNYAKKSNYSLWFSDLWLMHERSFASSWSWPQPGITGAAIASAAINRTPTLIIFLVDTLSLFQSDLCFSERGFPGQLRVKTTPLYKRVDSVCYVVQYK